MILTFLKVYAAILLAEVFHIFVVILYMNTATPNPGESFVPDWKLQGFLGGLAFLTAYSIHHQKENPS